IKVPGFSFCGSLSQSFNHFLSLFFATWVRSGNLTLPDAGSTILWQALQPYSFTSILPASFLVTLPGKSFFTSALKVLKNSIISMISCSDLHGTFGMTVSFKMDGGSFSQFLSHSSVLLKVTCVRSGPMTPPTHSMLWQEGANPSPYISFPLSWHRQRIGRMVVLTVAPSRRRLSRQQGIPGILFLRPSSFLD